MKSMLIQLHFYLLPVKAGFGDYEMPHFYINIYISFINEDIFIKFAENINFLALKTCL